MSFDSLANTHTQVVNLTVHHRMNLFLQSRYLPDELWCKPSHGEEIRPAPSPGLEIKSGFGWSTANEMILQACTFTSL